MILFLDFDGVLHPECEVSQRGEVADFCFLPRLESLLRAFPDVRVVISSTWREHKTLDELREMFSADIAARIIGATALPAPGAATRYTPARREREIVAWLQARGGLDQPWVALDDAEWQFDRYLDRDRRLDFFQRYRNQVLLFPVTEAEETALPQACRDPRDNKFLALAAHCSADVVVSSDDDLLVLNPWQDIPILTPAQFLK